MDRQTLINGLTNIIGDYLKSQGLVLVDLAYRYQGRDIFLRILADRPEGGITLDECARLNNEISGILDKNDILQDRYILEVFSPGVDRPLVTKGDFLRCMNRKARFFLKETIDGKTELEGTVNKVDDDAVYIEKDGKILNIPLSKIARVKQAIENI